MQRCDVVALNVEDVAHNGHSSSRPTVSQKKTRRSVRFELTEQTCQIFDAYLKAADKKPREFYGPPVKDPMLFATDLIA
jgi:hypothetical protein